MSIFFVIGVALVLVIVMSSNNMDIGLEYLILIALMISGKVVVVGLIWVLIEIITFKVRKKNRYR